MPQWIEAGVAQGDRLTQVLAEDGKQVLAQGYEVSRTCVSGELSWQERVVVVRSYPYAQTQRRHLEDRLAKAREGLLALTPKVGTRQTPDHRRGSTAERSRGRARQASCHGSAHLQV
jgi:hypothetical protein